MYLYCTQCFITRHYTLTNSWLAGLLVCVFQVDDDDMSSCINHHDVYVATTGTGYYSTTSICCFFLECVFVVYVVHIEHTSFSFPTLLGEKVV